MPPVGAPMSQFGGFGIELSTTWRLAYTAHCYWHLAFGSYCSHQRHGGGLARSAFRYAAPGRRPVAGRTKHSMLTNPPLPPPAGPALNRLRGPYTLLFFHYFPDVLCDVFLALLLVGVGPFGKPKVSKKCSKKAKKGARISTSF